jgi:hypothetical protein
MFLAGPQEINNPKDLRAANPAKTPEGAKRGASREWLTFERAPRRFNTRAQ